MGVPAIYCRDLETGYGLSDVLHGVDLDVPEGSVYAFLGRNGAGKSTTIRVLMGLLPRSRGEVAVLGRDPGTQAPDLMREVGYVSERQELYDHMRVGEIVDFSGSFYETHDPVLAAELLARFDLDPARKVSALSRGMRGKLCLVLALSHDPRLLILDEPTSGLDAVVRREFLESIIDIISREGRTVLFSTHIIEEAERVADRIGVLNGGRVVLEGGLEEILATTRRLRLCFDDDPPSDLALPGTLRMRREDNNLLVTIQDVPGRPVRDILRTLPLRAQTSEALSLEELFVDLVN